MRFISKHLRKLRLLVQWMLKTAAGDSAPPQHMHLHTPPVAHNPLRHAPPILANRTVYHNQWTGLCTSCLQQEGSRSDPGSSLSKQILCTSCAPGVGSKCEWAGMQLCGSMWQLHTRACGRGRNHRLQTTATSMRLCASQPLATSTLTWSLQQQKICLLYTSPSPRD